MTQDRRRPAREVSPTYEDAGIFKTQLVELVVDLVPRFARNSRGDLMIKGFVAGDGAIDVVFPGRRGDRTRPLVARLEAVATRAQAGGNTAALDRLRHSVRIQGVWRPRFSCDDQGWQTRQHQLYAARWLILDQEGNAQTYGEVPTR